jgi:hypothetical protein
MLHAALIGDAEAVVGAVQCHESEGLLLLSPRLINDRPTFLELLARIDGEAKIALEATYGRERLTELLEEAGLALIRDLERETRVPQARSTP